jgi:hypothetical protein
MLGGKSRRMPTVRVSDIFESLIQTTKLMGVGLGRGYYIIQRDGRGRRIWESQLTGSRDLIEDIVHGERGPGDFRGQSPGP